MPVEIEVNALSQVKDPFNGKKNLRQITLHSVCFINNVYKQRFFQLVKIFQNLNNRTSQNLYVKQRMN